MTTETSKKEKPKNSGLKKCFAALVDRKQVNLDLEVLSLMIKHELFLNIDSLEQNLSSVLPFMLVIYIRNWPGWQRSKEYYSGKLKFKEWYEKFRQYIVLRMNFLIKSGYNQAIEMIKEEEKNANGQQSSPKSVKDSGSQTDNLAQKDFAPFSIAVQCPPGFMSSLVFTDSGDDIVLKQHPPLPWTPIGMIELLNWPYIGVEFCSTELIFKRFNRSEYIRYLNLTNCPIVPEESDFIEKVEIASHDRVRSCYTLKMLRSYTDQLFDVARIINSVSSEYIDVLKVVVGEFLKDIEEIEMNNTIATNTKVLFNIGRSSFVRNKKVSKGTSFHTGPKVEVGYCEKFVPKMEIELTDFSAVQDVRTNDITFVSLNVLRENAAAINSRKESAVVLPSLVFHCLFCETTFRNHKEILIHLEFEHKMEPNFMCDKCMKLISIPVLTKMRWNHVCRPTLNGHSSRAAVSRK